MYKSSRKSKIKPIYRRLTNTECNKKKHLRTTDSVVRFMKDSQVTKTINEREEINYK